MKRYFKFITIFIVGLFLLGACGKEKTSEEDDGKLKVVTTYSIVYDIVKNIGGDLVEIHSLAPIGSNPHEYDPLPDRTHVDWIRLVLNYESLLSHHRYSNPH